MGPHTLHIIMVIMHSRQYDATYINLEEVPSSLLREYQSSGSDVSAILAADQSESPCTIMYN